MAIEKQFNSGFGVPFAQAYWCINSVRIEKPSQFVTVEMTVFADAAARANGFDPVASQIFRLQVSSYSDVVDNGFSAIYNALKADQLQGGIDV